ncbi:protein NRT1/ PTR FAMILY 2.8 [Tripterygium wilfordii]|nr:protein NRT1/ PTR FAMILY 2.8 [Tripterygium wilfordii]
MQNIETETTMVDMVHSSSSSSTLPATIPLKKKIGGWRAIKYILGNESFEKLASMSLIANMTVYLKTKYNMDGVRLVNVYSLWVGSSNLTSLAGAIISDGYLGRFHTLLFGSIASFLGMGTMTLTAAIPQLRPSACVDKFQCPHPVHWQLGVLYVALTLLAIGAGGIRPCNIAFGADQFDTRTEKGIAQMASFFNWWYFSFTVALVIALSVVVYVQTSVSWVVGYAIPTFCFVISITLFLIGRHTYIMIKPQGSDFVDLAKAIVAAFRKRNLTLDSASGYSLYDPPVPESDQHLQKLAHTHKFRCLEKAAVITDPSELDDHGKPKNNWRLCSVQQVEKLKLVIGLLPVWLAGIGFLIGMDQMGTFGVLQAIQMNKSIGSHFKVPPGWMGLSSMITLAIWIFIYERLFIPYTKKFSKKDRRFTMRQRINTGIVMGILCMIVGAIVEKKRRETALANKSFESPLSVAYLLPQYALSGLIEAFAAVALLEFFTKQLPESMRTFSGAIFFLSLSIASYLNSALVNVIHRVTGKNGNALWVGGQDLNQDRLENYFYIIAGIQALTFVYFNVFASRFLVINRSKDDEEGIEMAQAL